MQITQEQLASLGTKMTMAEFNALDDWEQEALMTQVDGEDEPLRMSDEDAAAAAAVAAEGDGDEPAEEGDDAKAPPKTEAKPDAKTDDKAAPKTDETPAAEEPQEQPRKDFVYQPKVADLSKLAQEKQDISAKFKAYETQLEALDAKFDEGELTAQEHRKGIREIERQRSEHNARLVEIAKEEAKAETNAANAQEMMAQRWEWTAEHIFKDPRYKALYSHAELGARAKESFFDFAARLGKQAENAGEGRTHDLDWYAEEAHKRVVGFMGPDMEVAKIAISGAKKKGAEPPTAKPTRDPDLSKVPTSLKDLPAGGGGGPGEDTEFAYLEKLEGQAYLDAIAAMPRDKRERFESQD